MTGAVCTWYHVGMMPELGKPSADSVSICGLYMHIPFCERKCGYCDFYSVSLKGRDTGLFVERLVRELGRRLADNPHKVRTVFLGGGTPTILPRDQLTALLKALSRLVPVRELAEFTVEANPATVDDEKATLLVEAGVTRVSVGAQSFFPAELTTLERIHSPVDIPFSVATLRRNGIRQINLDLIFGIPGQTVETWKQSLRRAIDLGPDHIACYALTYEPGTRLTAQRQQGRVNPCDEAIEAEMFELATDTLAEAGYEQYEISNYARPGCQSQHNLIYWRNQPYIGVGPSAAGCLAGRRYKNIPDVDGYIRMIDERGHAEAESETIDTQKLMIEMIMMQLRLTEGLSIASFRERTGVDPLTQFNEVLRHLSDLVFVTITDTYIALTRKGRLVADTVMTELACACGDTQKRTTL